MARDYAAEYARRVAKERERADAEGRPYDPTRARGHAREGHETERLKGRLRYWTKHTRYGLPEDEYAEDVQSAVDRVGPLYMPLPMRIQLVIDILKDKAATTRAYLAETDDGESHPEAAYHSRGKDRWGERIAFIPWTLYFYHGGDNA